MLGFLTAPAHTSTPIPREFSEQIPPWIEKTVTFHYSVYVEQVKDKTTVVAGGFAVGLFTRFSPAACKGTMRTQTQQAELFSTHRRGGCGGNRQVGGGSRDRRVQTEFAST